ncbi:MAG: transporter substrate-binding domain-containing protein [Synergistaceae bacterium]|nr:transporter substrate-binding domain-containing protein [Synergistaceae bacterium]
MANTKFRVIFSIFLTLYFCSFSEAITINAIKERGIIRVGTAGDYCPMSFLNPETGNYEGFDVDLAQDLAASLGVNVEFVPTSWPTLMADTLAEKFDLAICGITITESRLEKALMSNGYLDNGKTILIRAEDVEKYKTLADINRPGVVVMENPGGTNEKFARANLPKAKIIIHNVNEEIPALIAEGKADVMITEMAEAGYYTKRDKRLAAPLITKPFSSGKIGVLMSKNSPELRDFVNSFLEMNTGRLDELRQKYIGTKY